MAERRCKWGRGRSQCQLAPNVVTFTGTPNLTLGGFSTTVAGLNSANVPAGFSPTVQNASPTAASLTVNIAGAVNDSFDGFLSDGTGEGPLSLIKTARER